jgi:hypothetical protein
MLRRRLCLCAVLLALGQCTCLVSRELVNDASDASPGASPGARRHGGLGVFINDSLPEPPLLPGGGDDVDESSAHNLLQTWDRKDMDPGDSASVVKEREVVLVFSTSRALSVSLFHSLFCKPLTTGLCAQPAATD